MPCRVCVRVLCSCACFRGRKTYLSLPWIYISEKYSRWTVFVVIYSTTTLCCQREREAAWETIAATRRFKGSEVSRSCRGGASVGRTCRNNWNMVRGFIVAEKEAPTVVKCRRKRRGEFPAPPGSVSHGQPVTRPGRAGRVAMGSGGRGEVARARPHLSALLAWLLICVGQGKSGEGEGGWGPVGSLEAARAAAAQCVTMLAPAIILKTRAENLRENATEKLKACVRTIWGQFFPLSRVPSRRNLSKS